MTILSQEWPGVGGWVGVGGGGKRDQVGSWGGGGGGGGAPAPPPPHDPAAVAVRLRAYREQTAPVLDWYAARGGVIRIPAVGSVEEIAGRVEGALAAR